MTQLEKLLDSYQEQNTEISSFIDALNMDLKNNVYNKPKLNLTEYNLLKRILDHQVTDSIQEKDVINSILNKLKP